MDEKKHVLLHLEEARKRIIVSIAAVILLSVLSYIFSEHALRFLTRYVSNLVFISPEEAFLSYVKVAVFCGLILAAPVILYNVLQFIWIALKKEERGLFVAYLISAILLFLAGVFFSYFVALPAGIRFLLSFSSSFLQPFISVARYLSFSIFLILAFAVAFETPLFVVFLTRLGLLNSEVLRKKRRYFIVVLFVVAAFLTPPDVITQILLAVPLIVLYEISVIVAGAVEKKR